MPRDCNVDWWGVDDISWSKRESLARSRLYPWSWMSVVIAVRVASTNAATLSWMLLVVGAVELLVTLEWINLVVDFTNDDGCEISLLLLLVLVVRRRALLRSRRPLGVVGGGVVKTFVLRDECTCIELLTLSVPLLLMIRIVISQCVLMLSDW